MKTRDESAFPVGNQHSGLLDGGLTKREYFAVMAMQGLIASTDWSVSQVNEIRTAELSIAHADELLKQLES